MTHHHVDAQTFSEAILSKFSSQKMDSYTHEIQNLSDLQKKELFKLIEGKNPTLKGFMSLSNAHFTISKNRGGKYHLTINGELSIELSQPNMQSLNKILFPEKKF